MIKKVALFIAGGIGKRLWPKSDNDCPKQFSSFFNNEKTLIQESVERLSFFTHFDDMYIVTNKAYEQIMLDINIPISKKNIFYEPLRKNTLPAINFALEIIRRKYQENVIVAVLPCDHYIGDLEQYKKAILLAADFAERNECIVTIGIKPTNANTNYGYIKQGNKILDDVYKADCFYEKPNYETAIKYISSKEYLWNSGIFVFRLSEMMDRIKKYAQKQYSLFEKCDSDDLCSSGDKLFAIYNQLDSLSIDKGIIEKCKELFVVKSNFDWDDLGTWQSLEKYCNEDTSHNRILPGGVVVLNDTTNVSVFSYDKKEVIVSGVDDCLIVVSNNRLLVINKKDINNIPSLVDLMESNKNENK